MLVKELGGDGIHVESEIGKGTCFSFTLKVEEANSSDIDIPGENLNIFIPSLYVKSLSRKITILIVDDTYFNVLAFKQILKSEGINCEYALSGEDALIKLKEREYACLLMDCEMPIMDGWETTKRIHLMENNKEIAHRPAIIAYTAHNLDIVKQKCIESGMDDVLIKPCERDILISKVLYWIDK